ncbi:MAG: hypothetical protein AAF202_04230, partial [Pseudomonadota bacterium]
MSQNQTKLGSRKVELNSKFKEKMSGQVSTLITRSLQTTAILNLGLLLSIYLVTPLFRKSPWIAAVFSCSVLFQSLMPFVLNLNSMRQLSPKAKAALFWVSISLPALVWGGFSSWVVYEYLISWTTFYVILVSCVVAVMSTPVLFPRLSALGVVLSLQLIPPVMTSLLFLNGQQGLAFAVFFVVFALLLFRLGLQQNTSFWENLKNTNKIEAVMDALPGAIVWLDADRNLKGA